MSDSPQEETAPEAEPLQVFFTSEFKRNLRRLAKKYRHIQADVQPVLDQLLAGETPGDQIPRVSYAVWKVRLQNRDINKGKDAGYRVIYYVQTLRIRILITIYSKTEQGDASPEFIRRIIEEHEAAASTDDT